MSIVEEMKPPKKRKFFDESLTDTTLKKALLESEQEKIGLLRNINSKMDKVVDLLGQIVGIQNRLLSNTTSQLHPLVIYQILQRCFHHLLLNRTLLRLCNNIFLAMTSNKC